MKKALLFSFVFVLALVTQAWAQNRTVTGRVTDAQTGEGMPGVTVQLKGTTTASPTDVNGGYEISVPSNGGTLVFSFIGYAKQEIAVGTQSTVNVKLGSDARQISEIVITGYGVQEKIEPAGSTAKVSGATIENLPMQSFDRALQGRAAGVQVTAQSGQPGGALTVRVRGQGSINAGNDPLYIVDGVMVANGATSGQASSNALASINPNDIESMEVLKDAAAASIYGAQAANGVVLITTKRGKSGKTKFTISAQEGVVERIKKLDVTTAAEFAEMRIEALYNQYFDVYGPTVPTNPVQDTRTYTRNLAIAAHGDPATVQNTDWQDAIYRKGRLRTYDFSANGGDEKTRFLLSASYNKQEGQILKSDFERATARLNLDHKVSDKLSFLANVSLSHLTQNGNIADGASINSPQFAAPLILPNQPIYREDGSYNAPLVGAFSYNVVQNTLLELRQNVTNQTVSSFKTVYKVAPGIFLSALAGLDFADSQDDNYRPADIPQFAAIGGQATNINRRTLNWNTNVTLNYNKTFAELHNFSALVGAEYREEERETSTAQGEGFPSGQFQTLASAANPKSVSGTYTTYKMGGVFTNLKYDLDGKYFLSGTLRYDGSSKFGANNRFGLFYAGAVAWALNKEAFLADATYLDNLKLRLSYGVTGNSQIGNFASLGLLGSGPNYVGTSGIRPSQLPNPDLTWEEAKTINLGLDWSFFNSRVSGAVDVYRRKNERLLLDRPLPTDTGFGLVTENVGVVLNEGVEIELNTINVDAGDFTWKTMFNVTFQRNEILELIDGQQKIGNTLRVGQPIDILWYPEYAGVNPADGRPMYYDSLGNITYTLKARDSKVVGQYLPKTFGGFNNSFSYKGLSLDVFFQGSFGSSTLNNNAYFMSNSATTTYNQTRDQYTERWTTPGQITDVPRPYSGTEPNTNGILNFTTKQVEDNSYIRLKQVTLGYSLPESLISRVKLSNVRVFVQGLNLATWTGYSGLDPELLYNEIGTYPQAKQYTGGITVSF
ncbi:SusC/RagA family TonB-linked outer membrane protein [Nibribacter ruber]|uniref:SusC/RagA family TonB-linked outer membrane protein n=1 Tax=Nibribacter ruber TaxID=2698458 RepID=A0A6P1P2L3_9BACT|nr:TonB-dependent receptor [Nibribacter ruber]QHL88649.1 SusC/RagA family TonB-linked outer membrane protein [Nibribacter ruber]